MYLFSQFKINTFHLIEPMGENLVTFLATSVAYFPAKHSNRLPRLLHWAWSHSETKLMTKETHDITKE